MNKQHLADHCEDIVVARDINYPNVKQGLIITRQFIIDNNLILIGGMAIDISLRAQNKDGIYKSDKLPDYDFVTPDSVKHSAKLGAILCKKGLPSIAIINAMHTTTRRVRVDSHYCADMGYCPLNIFEKLPYIEYDGMRIIHPHFQCIDIHHSLSFPYENPTMPVVSHRWKRDMHRYDLLIDAYPVIPSNVQPPKMVSYIPDERVLSGSCLTGWAALSYWKNGNIEVPFGEPIHILSDDFEQLVSMSEEDPVYFESAFGKIPRNVIVKINGTSYEVFDNLGEKVSAEKVGFMHVANLQHVMMIFLAKKYLCVDSPINAYYNTGYIEAAKMIPGSTTLGVIPSINIYGIATWADSYIINRKQFANRLNNIKTAKSDTPKNIYPAAPGCNTSVTFDYNSSIYFNITGQRTSSFKPKMIKFLDIDDVVTSPPTGGKPTRTNAWVTLVMIGTQYVPGAIMLAHSLRSVDTEYDIICMVTPDIGDVTRRQLDVVFDRVVEVQYLEHGTTPLKSEKQKKMYGAWASRSFTKWQCLDLTEYKKVMFIDADQLVLQNNDELFELNAPAGTFSTPWIAPFCKSSTPNPYGKLEHEAIVSHDMINNALQNGSVVSMASLVLLEPSTSIYTDFITYLNNAGLIGADVDSLSSSDEIALAQFTLSIDMKWTNIHQSFQAVPSKECWLDGEIARAYHYIGRKPWDSNPKEWPDIRIWWDNVNELIKTHPILRSVFYSDELEINDINPLAAELAEYRMTTDIISLIISTSGNRSHRNKIEVSNIMERWVLTMANTPKVNGWANVYRESVITDHANTKMAAELVEKGIMKQETAADLVFNIVNIVNNRLNGVPRNIDADVVCTDTSMQYGSQYIVVNITNQHKRLIALGGCEETLRVAMRYDTIVSKGNQWGIPQFHVDYLYSTWNVRGEAFASPLNSRLLGKRRARFCSLFPDIDGVFGSIGSFFNPNLDRSGNWVVNPPFIESIMVAAVNTVLTQLRKRKNQTFFFIIPAWTDSPAYKLLHKSDKNRAELKLTAGTYFFENPNDEKMLTRASSIYFAISNDQDTDFMPALLHIQSQNGKSANEQSMIVRTKKK
jgi:hypothetical protein